MGLDSVELVMAIEEEFQLVIADEEAGNIQTPRELTDLLYSKLRQSRNDPCQSQHAFYVVRNTLVEVAGIKKNQIKPHTNLNTLIPKENRKNILKEIISSISGGKTIYVELVRPTEIMLLIYFLITTTFFTIQFCTNLDLLFNILISFAFWAALIAFTSPFRSEFPKNFLTVKDLTRIIGSSQSKIWNREELWGKIKTIIVEQLGVTPKEVLPDVNFINDLGMD